MISRIRARRAKRAAPKNTFYGGSKEATDNLRSQAAKGLKESRQQYTDSTGKVSDAADTATDREASAQSDYTTSRRNSGMSRERTEESIDNIDNAASDANSERGRTAGAAISQRSNALANNDLNKIAQQNILAQQALAGQTLNNNLGMLARSSRGLASGMGEGGALALQQAMASQGANAADLANQNQLQLTQQANDTRNTAAQQQVVNALQTANLNAGTLTDLGNNNAATLTGAAQAKVQGNMGLTNADYGQQANLGNRQTQLLGQSLQGAQAGSALALENQGQFLNNQQAVNAAGLAVDQQNANNDFQRAKANNPFQTLVSTVFDPADLRGSGSKGIV